MTCSEKEYYIPTRLRTPETLNPFLEFVKAALARVAVEVLSFGRNSAG